MRLANKTALITGGNSGIGLATARLFVAEGARVAITGRNQATLDAALAELGPNAIALRADLDEPGAPERTAAEAAERLGPLDIVFANAGIPGNTPLGSTTLVDFERVLRTNVTSVFFTVQGALPHLREGSSIILTSSVLRTLALPGYSAYSASKAAVHAMMQVMATELSPRGIRVNLVSPGATRTPIWDSRAPTPEAFAAFEAQIAKTIPLGRLAEAEDVAAAVLFLASDEARNIHATELVVDAGTLGAPRGAPMFRG